MNFRLLLFGTIVLIVIANSCKDNPDLHCIALPFNPLVGIWKVVKISDNTIDWPYCDDLKVGAKFIFDCDSRLFVYAKNSKKPCTDFKFGYGFHDSEIEIWEWDMRFVYEINYFQNDTLIITNREKLILIRTDNQRDRFENGK